jgi:hypothetical protein
LQLASPAHGASFEHFLAAGAAQTPDAEMLAPWAAAIASFQYVTPSHPHCGSNVDGGGVVGRVTHVPAAAQPATLQYSSDLQAPFAEGLHAEEPASGVPLVPELVPLVPELPFVPLVPLVPLLPELPLVPELPLDPDELPDAP